MLAGPGSGREKEDFCGGREKDDLFVTLGDGAEVTLSGNLRDDMGVDALSGRCFLKRAASFLMASI